MSCGVGHRCSSDLAWLWLWHRLAAIAMIRPLAWEFPYAAGAALKSKKQKKIFFEDLWCFVIIAPENQDKKLLLLQTPIPADTPIQQTTPPSQQTPPQSQQAVSPTQKSKSSGSDPGRLRFPRPKLECLTVAVDTAQLGWSHSGRGLAPPSPQVRSSWGRPLPGLQ